MLTRSATHSRAMRLLCTAFALISAIQAQQTFQNAKFDLPADLPVEDPTILAQLEGVATQHVKNDLKPVKLNKPASLAVAKGSAQPPHPVVPLPITPPAVAQPPPPGPAPAVAPIPGAPVAAQLPPHTLPGLPGMPGLPTMAPFTLPTFTFPSHPTFAPFTFPSHAPFTFPPHPALSPFTFAPPVAPPVPAAAAANNQAPVPQVADYDIPFEQKEAQPVQQSTAAPAATAQPIVNSNSAAGAEPAPERVQPQLPGQQVPSGQQGPAPAPQVRPTYPNQGQWQQPQSGFAPVQQQQFVPQNQFQQNQFAGQNQFAQGQQNFQQPNQQRSVQQVPNQFTAQGQQNQFQQPQNQFRGQVQPTQNQFAQQKQNQFNAQTQQNFGQAQQNQFRGQVPQGQNGFQRQLNQQNVAAQQNFAAQQQQQQFAQQQQQRNQHQQQQQVPAPRPPTQFAAKQIQPVPQHQQQPQPAQQQTQFAAQNQQVAASGQPLQVQPTVPQQQHIVQHQQVPSNLPQAHIQVTPAPLQSKHIKNTPIPTRPRAIRMEKVNDSGEPSRVSNWFSEHFDTSVCKNNLTEIAEKFKNKFPNYLQKGGKDAALAELVEQRLVECDRKGSTGHWDKVDELLAKIQLSKSEESDCRAGLIQERISCYNLLNYACQFTQASYRFKLVPARITIQEARQAENGADKCRKVVRIVKKRLEG